MRDESKDGRSKCNESFQAKEDERPWKGVKRNAFKVLIRFEKDKGEGITFFINY